MGRLIMRKEVFRKRGDQPRFFFFDRAVARETAMPAMITAAIRRTNQSSRMVMGFAGPDLMCARDVAS